MTCCNMPIKRRVKRLVKRLVTKREVTKLPTNSIHPEPTSDIHVQPASTIDGKIKCGGCTETFDLDSNELKIHCNLCNQFFHCKIAGKCDGESCRIEQIDGKVHQASYCYDCVGLLTDKKILCKDCTMELIIVR